MQLNLFSILLLSITCASVGICSSGDLNPSRINGCYEPPAYIDSGNLRMTSFKDVLLLGDAAPGPQYVAIARTDEKGTYEFRFFDSTAVKERYRIIPDRNAVKNHDSGITFSTCRRASAEGVNWKSCGVITLSLTSSGDLRVDVEITTVNRSLIIFSKKEQVHLSFNLRRLADQQIESLTLGERVGELPGP